VKRSVYKRPNKPSYMIVTKRQGFAEGVNPLRVPEVVEVDSRTECHVTPLDVAARMVEYLGPVGDYLTIDPQAGTGSLIQALFDSGHSPRETVAIEKHSGLCQVIRKRFSGDQYIEPINRCFLEYAAEAKGKIEYPRIITNPPFRHVRKHMQAALNLLGSGGHDVATLVALVPITYQHDEAEELEILDRETFPTAAVNTKIIRIER
jgi:phospholipid N-methyltransferase